MEQSIGRYVGPYIVNVFSIWAQLSIIIAHSLYTSIYFQVAALGAMTVTQAAAKLMQQNAPGPDGERGVIVNMGGIAAMKAFSGIPGYCGMNGYINSMTRALAKDLAVYGIRVNCVNAGEMIQ